MGINTPAPKKPKPRSFAPPNESPFSSQNKGPLKKTKSKAVPRKVAAPKKTPVKAAAFRKSESKSPPAPKKAAMGKLTAPTTNPARTAAAVWEAQKMSKAKADILTRKGGDGGEVDAGNGVRKAAPKQRGRPAKEQSFVSKYLQQSGVVSTVAKAKSVAPATSTRKLDKQSVLVRHTATALYEFKQLNGGMYPEEVGKAKKADARFHRKKVQEEEVKMFRVMDLPSELRAKVWRASVVRPRGFIWPEEKLTREQPDLAMTCRQVRGEVLPIFYAENVFAVSIATPVAALMGKRQGVHIFQRWAEALEGTPKQPGWFSFVRRWAISYEAPNNHRIHKLFRVRASGNITVDRSFLVAVSFSKRKYGEDGAFWDANVEVHREAPCILPGREDYGTCKVRTVPAWLNNPVIAITEAAKGVNVTPQMMLELLREVAEKADQVSELKCEDPLKPGPVVVDLDKHCGVVGLGQSGQCTRSLNCKGHSMLAKRAVNGRSGEYDRLLREYLRMKERSRSRSAEG